MTAMPDQALQRTAAGLAELAVVRRSHANSVNLEEKLFEAACRVAGLEMIDLLKEAATKGLTRIEGEQMVERVYDRLCETGTEEQPDLVSDVWDITRDYCHRDNRIWPPQ